MPAKPSPMAAFAAIGLVVVAAGAAFAYTGGWLTPSRLTPGKLVDALAPPGGPALGHRRNHAKGICFTGTFAANGKGVELSSAPVFVAGQYPVIGRLNLATANPEAADASVRVRGIGIEITAPDGQQWRSAMITAPVFPVSTPRAFYGLLKASASKDPKAMPAFAAAHPEIAAFGAWAKSAPWTGSYAEDRFNSLDAFLFTDAAGKTQAVRWSLIPEAAPTAVTPDDLAKGGPDVLEKEITARVGRAPALWRMVVTVANPGDPTADPSKAWPDDRRTVEVGTLSAQKIIAEADGPCRDINYDPTVLPYGIEISDDPLLPARSAAYAISYLRRTSEEAHLPGTATATTKPGSKL